MNDFESIYEWLKACPKLERLWAVSSNLKGNENVLQPNSSANMYEVEATQYADGQTRYIFQKTKPYFFDIDIVCYRIFYADYNPENIATQADVQEVCDWIIKQQNENNYPILKNGCFMVECLTPHPFMRGQYEQDGDTLATLVDYVVTVRFYTDNPATEKTVVRR